MLVGKEKHFEESAAVKPSPMAESIHLTLNLRSHLLIHSSALVLYSSLDFHTVAVIPPKFSSVSEKPTAWQWQ